MPLLSHAFSLVGAFWIRFRAILKLQKETIFYLYGFSSPLGAGGGPPIHRKQKDVKKKFSTKYNAHASHITCFLCRWCILEPFSRNSKMSKKKERENLFCLYGFFLPLALAEVLHYAGSKKMENIFAKI